MSCKCAEIADQNYFMTGKFLGRLAKKLITLKLDASRISYLEGQSNIRYLPNKLQIITDELYFKTDWGYVNITMKDILLFYSISSQFVGQNQLINCTYLLPMPVKVFTLNLIVGTFMRYLCSCCIQDFSDRCICLND